MFRRKVLIGYETNLITGTTFAKYRKEVVEDDESVTYDGIHRQTITSEEYDALKKLAFADEVVLAQVKTIDSLTKEITSLEAETEEIIKTKDAEIATLKEEIK